MRINHEQDVMTGLATGEIQSSEIEAWLGRNVSKEQRQRVWDIGLLTGWRHFENDTYGAANFERGLILEQLMERLRPKAVLEVGTGRGLGTIVMASAAVRLGLETRITSLDVVSSDQLVSYPIRLHGQDKVLHTSRQRVWKEHFPADVLERIDEVSGSTRHTLPRLLREKRSYDLIFIDAGHDTYSVYHDVSYAMCMLGDGETILMDDFAPLEDFGIGTCLVALSMRSSFSHVCIFPTEARVYGEPKYPMYPRGMVLLQGLKRRPTHVSRMRLCWWRLLGQLLEYGLRSPWLFPATGSSGTLAPGARKNALPPA